MSYPPRLSHLATTPILVAKFLPTYMAAHQVDDDEAASRLERALKGQLRERLLTACWDALTAQKRRLNDDGLLEKVAGSLADRPLRRGRVAKLSPAWSAFLVLIDIEAGTAADTVRRAMENEIAQQKAAEGIVEAGAHLAAELTR
jgi:hypothetical protein